MDNIGLLEALLVIGGIIVLFLILRAFASMAITVIVVLFVLALVGGLSIGGLILKAKDATKDAVNTTCADDGKQTNAQRLQAKKNELARVRLAIKRTNQKTNPDRYNQLSTRAASLDAEILKLQTCIQVSKQDQQ